jgi:hypothetical protein
MEDNNLKENQEAKIVRLYNQGHSIKQICSLYHRKYTQTTIARLITEHQINIQREFYLTIPSVMNLDYQIKK